MIKRAIRRGERKVLWVGSRAVYFVPEPYLINPEGEIEKYTKK